MTISSASLKSSSGNPSTLCISTLLCESVNAGDFFSASTEGAPENDVPGRSASYDDANRAKCGFHNDPSPVRFCLLRAQSRPASAGPPGVPDQFWQSSQEHCSDNI